MTVYSHTDRQRSPAGNRRLAKKRVQYLNEALRFVSSLVLADSLVLRKSASSPSAKPLPAILKDRHRQTSNERNRRNIKPNIT